MNEDLIPTSSQNIENISYLERIGFPFVWFGFFAAVTVFFLYQIVGGLVAFLVVGFEFSQGNATLLRVVTAGGQILFLFIPTLLLTRLASNQPIEFLRFTRPDFRLVILPIFGIFSLQQIYLLAQDKIPLPEKIQEFVDQLKQILEESYKLLAVAETLPELIVVLVIIAVIPAIVEELLFRGLIQSSVEKGSTPVMGFIFTGILFGVFHLNPFTFVALAVIGIYLGFLRFKSKSIWVPIFAHFYNNAFVCLAIYFGQDENELIIGNPETFSFETILLLLSSMLLIFFLSTYFFIRISEQRDNTVNPSTI